MKSIMISIKPKYCALEMNGVKSIEVRRNKALASAIRKLIDKYGYADIYVYCSKDGELFYNPLTRKWFATKNRNIKKVHRLSNGVVKFKFRCYKVEEIKLNLAMRFFTESMFEPEIAEKSCLSSAELFNYLHTNSGYAIHISNLEIFDRPKELSEFKQPRDSYGKVNWNTNEYYYMNLTQAPQKFCYVEV